MDDPEHRNTIVAIARRWIGTDYYHQASLEGVGADCLGLFRGIWRELFGCEPAYIPSYSSDWNVSGDGDILRDAAARIMQPARSLKPEHGDLILFRMKPRGSCRHVGIFASDPNGHDSFIHTYSLHGVVESAFTEAWARRLGGVYKIPARSS